MSPIVPTVLLTAVTFLAIWPVSKTAPAGKADHSADDKKIICYYSSWSGYRPAVGAFTIDDIPVHLCTHVIYAFIGLNNRTWELLVLDPNSDITKGGYRKFTSLKKKNPHLKTLISVGGWVEGGQKYSQLVSRPERRKIFVNSVVDFLKWFNFDGLDLDWEFPGSLDRHGRAEDKDNFIQLVQELRHAFDKEGWGWSLTAVVPIMRFRVEGGYDVPKLASLVDHIHLLTYDLRGNWTGFTDVHAPLRARAFDQGDYQGVNVHDGTEYWIKAGAPPEKITVGLALYGRTYTLEDPASNGLHSKLNRKRTAGNPGPYTKANGTLAYYEICELFQSGGWERKYDDIGDSPYLVKGDQWIGYDDRNSLVRKVQFVQEKGYGGVAIWSVDLDDFRGVCGESRILLHAIYKQLTGRSPLGLLPTRLPESTQIDFLDLQTDSPPQLPSQTLNPFNGFTQQQHPPPPQPQPTPERFDFTGLTHQPGITTTESAGVHDQTLTHIISSTTTEEPRTEPLITVPTTEPLLQFETTAVPPHSTQNAIFVTSHSTETPPTLSGVLPEETFVPFGDRDHFRTTVTPVSSTEPTEPTFIVISSTEAAPSSLAASPETLFTTPVTEQWSPEVTWDADLFQAITTEPETTTVVNQDDQSDEPKVPASNDNLEETVGRLAPPQTKQTFEIQAAPELARIPEAAVKAEATTSTSQASSTLPTTTAIVEHSPTTTGTNNEITSSLSSSSKFQSVIGHSISNKDETNSDIDLEGPLAEVSAFDRIRTDGSTALDRISTEGSTSLQTAATTLSSDSKEEVTDESVLTPETTLTTTKEVSSTTTVPPRERLLRNKVPLRRRKTNRRKLQRTTTANATTTSTESSITSIRSTRVTNIRQRNRTDSQRSPRPSRRFMRRKTTTTTSSPKTEERANTVNVTAAADDPVTVTEVTSRKPLKRASTGMPSSVAALDAPTTIFPAESEHFTMATSRKPLRKRIRIRSSTARTTTTATATSKAQKSTTLLPIAGEAKDQVEEDQSNSSISVEKTSTGIKKPFTKVSASPLDEDNVTSAMARSVGQEVEIQDHLSKNRFSFPTMTSEGDYTAQSGTVDEVFIKFAPPSTTDEEDDSSSDDVAPTCSTKAEAFYSHRRCNKYWWCIHGTATLKECARGLVWHQETHTCDWESKLDKHDNCD